MVRIRKRPWLLALLALVALTAGTGILVSCKTAPPPEPAVEPEPEPEPAPVAAAPVPKPDAEYQTAKQMRATVTQYGLDKYDAASFQKAEASFKDGEAAYDKDNAKSKAAFQQAIAGYQKVMDAGFPVLVADKKKAADAAKADADSVKAGVAVKSDYNAAQNLYNQAASAEKAKDYPKSLDLYEQSRARFAAAAQTTRQLMAKAQASIEEVKKDLATAEQQAAEAEKIREEGGL
jgi:hypothetical protein